jgi:hypothetical protein
MLAAAIAPMASNSFLQQPGGHMGGVYPPYVQQQQQPPLAAGAAAPVTPIKGGGGKGYGNNNGGRGNGGKGGGKGKVIDQEALLKAVARLSLENAVAVRELQCTVMHVLLIPLDAHPVAMALAEGNSYSEEVKKNRGANLGSPHVRIAIKFFQALAEVEQVRADPVMKATLSQWWETEIMGGSKEELEKEFLIFKVRKPQQMSRIRQTPMGAAMDSYAKVTFRLGERSEEMMRGFLVFATEVLQWHEKTGVAPKGFLEREASKALGR